MQTLGEFKLPQFFNYPPYFTLQPVRDTREKQIQLWKELILDYCRTQKIFVIGLEEEFPLFTNSAIERSLSHEARKAFLSSIISDGRAEWMDKNHRRCLILWHRIQDWAEIILRFVKENGLEDSVMTVDEICTGIESRGTDIHGMDRRVLMRALKLLESKGKLAIFKGTSADDEGSLSHEARKAFLSSIISDGRAEWMDKNHRRCLILWHRIQDWAEIILRFVKENGLEDSVMTVDEIRTGIESRVTDIHGMDRGVLMRALKLLENKGKLAIFKGTSADDEGVKFSV